jgi:hypothetical protein
MSAFVTMLKQLFEEKFIEDSRTPVYTVVLHDYNVAVLPPSPILPLQVIVVSISQ